MRYALLLLLPAVSVLLWALWPRDEERVAPAPREWATAADAGGARLHGRPPTDTPSSPSLAPAGDAVLHEEARDVLRLRVIDSRGRPVKNARLSVSWRKAPGRYVAIGDGGPQLTDARGESVCPFRSGFEAVSIHAWRIGVGESGHLEVPLRRDGGPVEIPTLVLEGPGTIAGRALFPDGRPAIGVDVTCRLNEGERGRRGNSRALARTDGDGRFLLTGLREAKGKLGLVRPRTLDRPWPVPEVDVAAGDQDVLLEIPVPRIRLHIVDATGAPVVGASYRACLEGEGPPENLRERIDAADGTANVWGRPGDHVAVAVYSTHLRPDEAVVDMAPGVWTRDLQLVVQRWEKAAFGRVRFEVTHMDGDEVGPIVAYLRTPLAQQILPRFFRHSDGSPVLWSPDDPALPAPAGRWLLRIRAGEKPTDRWGPHEAEVEIRPGEETVFRATVQRAARLSMRLVPPGGEDDDLRWWARLIPDDGHERPIDKRSGPCRAYTWTLRAGGWSLRLEADGYQPISRHLGLAPGEEHDLELPLVRSP